MDKNRAGTVESAGKTVKLDKADPYVTIMLDKERHLLLTFRGMMAFKKVTGKDLRESKVVQALAKGVELEDVEALLWACLLHEDRELKLEDVGYMIHLGNMLEVLKAINDVFTLAAPEPDESEPEGSKKAVPLAKSPKAG